MIWNISDQNIVNIPLISHHAPTIPFSGTEWHLLKLYNFACVDWVGACWHTSNLFSGFNHVFFFPLASTPRNCLTCSWWRDLQFVSIKHAGGVMKARRGEARRGKRRALGNKGRGVNGERRDVFARCTIRFQADRNTDGVSALRTMHLSSSLTFSAFLSLGWMEKTPLGVQSAL